MVVFLALLLGAMLVFGLTWRDARGRMTDAEVVKKNAENFCFS